MRSIFLLTISFLTANGFALTTQGAPKVYVGGEGMKVTIVNLKGGDKSALVLYENSETAYDNKVLLHKIEEDRDGMKYVVSWDGESKYPLHKRGNNPFLTFYFKMNKSIDLKYDKKESEAVPADAILNRYLMRKSADRFKGALNSFDRKEETSKEEAKVKEATNEMNQACGSSIAVKIDWSAFNDDTLKSFEVGSACAAPLAAVERLCDDQVGKETIGKKIKSVTCTLGSKLALKVSSGELKWTTAKDAPDQENFAKVYLGDNL